MKGKTTTPRHSSAASRRHRPGGRQHGQGHRGQRRNRWGALSTVLATLGCLALGLSAFLGLRGGGPATTAAATPRLSDLGLSADEPATAAGPQGLWSDSQTPAGTRAPAVPSSHGPAGVELGVRLQTKVAGLVEGVRFYKGALNTGVHTGTLWSASGKVLATGTFAKETGSGWQTLQFATPVTVAAGTRLVVSYHTDSDHYTATRGYFSHHAVVTASLRAPATSNGVYADGSGFPTRTYRHTNYWVDVLFQPGPAPITTPPSASSTPATSTSPATPTIQPPTSSAPATASSPAPPTSPPSTSTLSHSIYWGAYIEGTQTYNYLYGGTWSNAPWCDPGTQCPLPKFTANAGKASAIEHWGMCWTCSFDSSVASIVVQRGDIPAVDWGNGDAPDASVAAGDYDNSTIIPMAKSIAAWGHPMFLLYDFEMNGDWYGWSPGQNGNTAASFVAMWRHVHDVFVAEGATNVTWVWCPNIDPGGIYPSYSSLYPGDAYVDWTGFDGYNWGGGAGGGWETFAQLFTTSYKTLLQVAPSKPIMIGEFASEEDGGSKAAWITDALSTQLPENFPQIKAVLWFNWRIYQKNQYWNWEIESSSASQQAFKTAISSSYYAPGGSFGNLPLHTKITPLS